MQMGCHVRSGPAGPQEGRRVEDALDGMVALLLGALSKPLHDWVPRHYLAPVAMTESWQK